MPFAPSSVLAPRSKANHVAGVLCSVPCLVLRPVLYRVPCKPRALLLTEFPQSFNAKRRFGMSWIHCCGLAKLCFAHEARLPFLVPSSRSKEHLVTAATVVPKS